MTEKDLPLSVFFAVQRLHPKKRRGFWRRWPKELEGYSKDRVSGIELRAAGWPSPEAEESEESDVRVLRDREGRIVAIDLTGDRWLTHEEYVAHIWWAAQEAERSRKEEETRKRYLAVRLAKQTANLAPDALPNLGKKKLAVFIMRLQETVDQIARADPEQAENSAEQLREAVAAIEAARVELASREDKGGVARRQAKTITMRKTTLVATIAGAFFLWLSATQAGKVELGRLVFHPVEVIPAYFSRCGDYEPDLASFESDAGRNYTQQDLRAFNRSVYKCRKNASVTGRWKTRTWVNLVGWLSLLTAAGALVVGGKELQTRVSRTKSRSPGHSVGRL